MKGLHLRRIAIATAIRAGIAVEAATASARLAMGASNMAEAGSMGKALPGIGIDRTGFQAGFIDTCVAKMNRFMNLGGRNLVFEQQGAAIGMP